jgi:hypothetical protein
VLGVVPRLDEARLDGPVAGEVVQQLLVVDDALANERVAELQQRHFENRPVRPDVVVQERVASSCAGQLHPGQLHELVGAEAVLSRAALPAVRLHVWAVFVEVLSVLETVHASKRAIVPVGAENSARPPQGEQGEAEHLTSGGVEDIFILFTSSRGIAR